MSDPVSPESMATIRILFFRRLAETNGDIIGILTDVAVQIEGHNHNALLALFVDVEDRIRTMRTILIVFRECLEG
jgi:hypothetical protein